MAGSYKHPAETNGDSAEALGSVKLSIHRALCSFAETRYYCLSVLRADKARHASSVGLQS